MKRHLQRNSILGIMALAAVVLAASCTNLIDGPDPNGDGGGDTTPATYAVTYNANGADSGTVPSEQTKTAGVDLTLSGNTGGLAKTGHTFAGWNTADDGTGDAYAEGATYSVDADLALYAQWIPAVAKILASDGAAADVFGDSVAISGDYAIVGAPGDDDDGTGSGSAHVFRRTGTNTWDSGTKIVASDGAAADNFGYSVAISGDYAIVGAYLNDDIGSGSGSAYVFRRTGTNTWDSGTKILASDGAASDQFGWSVAISGDYAIVGAPFDDDNGSASGSAYVFRRTGTNTWDSGTKIVASDGAAGYLFGTSVAISGDYAIVGAYGDDDKGSVSGSAYVFRRTGTDTWDSGTKIVASDGAAEDYFGWSVAISGDYAIVGAWRDDDNGSDSGSAYVFRRTGTDTWDSGTKILASDGAAADNFGYSVAISGDYAIVGAYQDDDIGSGSGSAYVFRRTGTNTWDSGTKILASDGAASDQFGWSVAISGDYAIVGAPYDDDNGLDSGSAYIRYVAP